jgi:prepilin-type N-terminal cleavage/methylation domain-containing protein
MNLKLLRAKQGFTLIELIISLAILSIVMTSIISFFLYNNRVFAKGVDQFNVQSNIRLASDYITNQIRYATKIEILDTMDAAMISDPLNEIDAYASYIYYENGKIIRLSKYNSNSFFVGVGGQIEFSSSAPGEILHFNVTGVDTDQTYFIDSEVKPLNLDVEGTTINDHTGPVIFYRTADDYLSKTALPEATLGDPANPEELYILYSKGILNVSVISDNATATEPVANLAVDSINELLVTIANPGASSGRTIVFVVELDDHGLYEYTVTYASQWNIE